MIDLFQDKRVYSNSKRKQNHKKMLPEIKYSPNFIKRVHEDVLLGPVNSRFTYSYQPLSNILVSKKINPPNPEQHHLLISKKRNQIINNAYNFKMRK
jgi:hypothetical protein